MSHLTGQGSDVVGLVGDEGIRGILAREVARQDGSRHDPRWHVLHAVHADVDVLVLKTQGYNTLSADAGHAAILPSFTLFNLHYTR